MGIREIVMRLLQLTFKKSFDFRTRMRNDVEINFHAYRYIHHLGFGVPADSWLSQFNMKSEISSRFCILFESRLSEPEE
jgi:hypothetical protein